MLYAFLAAGLISVASLGYGYVQHSGKEAALARVDALNVQIKAQNDAVNALKAESDAKQSAAKKALAKAEGKSKVWENNAVRLQNVLTNRKPDGDKSCAGAWKEIRKP